MRELGLVAGLLVLLLLFAAATYFDPYEVLAFGRATMLQAITVSVVFEALYLATLAWALRGRDVPRGWIWRSYLFHDRLRGREKWWVLPFFTIGWAAAAVASVGVLVTILAVVSGLRGG